MGTRAVIARNTASGFRGAYHHWDGYPSGLGAELYSIFTHQKRAMARIILDGLLTHSWSTIMGDWDKPVGFREIPNLEEKGGPQCYCHGDRSEEVIPVNHSNASGMGCEFVYVIEPDDMKMTILSSYHEDGQKAIGAFGCGDPNANWIIIGEVDLNAPEPNWGEFGES